MIDKLETYRGYRTIIPLSFLQILDLCIVPSRFCESLNKKDQMYELCMFSQIRSHNYYVYNYVTTFIIKCVQN